MEIGVSDTLLPYVEANPDRFEVLGELAPMAFDEAGNLAPMPTHGVRGDE
jgi:hypothetical protein